MKPAYERCSVVMIGAWNVAIFTGPWVQSVLLNGVKPEVKVVVAAQGLGTRFDADGVEFVVFPNQAQFMYSSFDDATLQRLESAALPLLTRLADTPVHGVGINFGFNVIEQCEPLSTMFAFDDNDKIKGLSWELTHTSVTRKLRQGDRAINLTVAKSVGGLTTVDFNHHFDVATAGEAAKRLRDNVIKSRDLSLGLAAGLYGLNMEAS